MKKWFVMVLTLCLLCSLTSTTIAEQTVYQLGDHIEDFGVTLSDGTETSLYGLLAEKDAVLINFWATYCAPCKNEFPFMQKAYDEMSDRIGIIALSTYPVDTDADVLAMKESLGLTTLPMGLDTIGLSTRFDIEGIPYSVMVDRNGIICFMEAGSIPDDARFLRLFDTFTAEDYSDPILLQEIPTAKPVNVTQPTAAEQAAALGISGDAISIQAIDAANDWPFVIGEDGVTASNTVIALSDSTAKLKLRVKVQQGEALGFQYGISAEPYYNGLDVLIDDAVVTTYAGEKEWTNTYIPFEAAGEYEVCFSFRHGTSSKAVSAKLGSMRIITADEAAAMDAVNLATPKMLSGRECTIVPVDGNVKEAAIYDNEEPVYFFGVSKSEEVTFRISIGEELDPDLVFITDGDAFFMLNDCKTDEKGYLFTSKMPYGQLYGFSMHMVSIYPSLLESAASIADYTYGTSEADIDLFAGVYSQTFSDHDLEWAYLDNTPKQQTDAAQEIVSATPMYEVSVVDEQGVGIAGVMVQYCDESTCAVEVTDEQGLAKHTGAAYAYEVHILMVPETYASDTQTYTMPYEGGSLTIVLQQR